jgi:hypothetical protein
VYALIRREWTTSDRSYAPFAHIRPNRRDTPMSPSAESVNLADIRDFAEVVKPLRKSQASTGASHTGFTQADGLYCAVCGGRRRMTIGRLY